MTLEEATYQVIYNEVWKLYRKTVGEVKTQDHLEDITESSKLIQRKISGIMDSYNAARLKRVENRLNRITDKLVKKVAKKKNGTRKK